MVRKRNSLKNIQMYDYTVNHLLFLKIIIKYMEINYIRTKLENLTYSINNYINFIKFNAKPNVNLLKNSRKKEKKFDITLDEILNQINSEKN